MWLCTFIRIYLNVVLNIGVNMFTLTLALKTDILNLSLALTA